jgi:DNA-binding NtrC family response regulator
LRPAVSRSGMDLALIRAKTKSQAGADMNAKANILVVDDEEVVRRSHLRTLESVACHVRAVLNGEQALNAMREQPYDVVLLDVRMPGMDGMSVLKKLKESWPDSEVIVITGYPCVDAAKEAIRLGAYDYLAKPLPPDAVIHAANGALEQKGWALRCDASIGREIGSTRGAPEFTGAAAN